MENTAPIPETDPILFPQGSPTDEEIRLRALNHTKDRLMSIVGHDLRTAIGGVLTITGMLDKSLEAKDVKEAKRLNGLIRRSSRDAEELLRDLLAWSQSSGEDIEFSLESIDILELVHTEVGRLRAVALKKHQRIRVKDYDSGTIRADRYMLSAVFRNLLTNALKFSLNDGIVTVNIFRQPGLWEFQVADKGIGMNADVQKRLLKIDDRKKQTGTSGEGGSGFGLLLCEDFIQRHGGHLTWESKPGKGSTFSFTVPELLG
jgi:signal transduction histidine kinase